MTGMGGLSGVDRSADGKESKSTAVADDKGNSNDINEEVVTRSYTIENAWWNELLQLSIFAANSDGDKQKGGVAVPVCLQLQPLAMVPALVQFFQLIMMFNEVLQEAQDRGNLAASQSQSPTVNLLTYILSFN